ncbi:unnamed protein product [Laminaria digitata]
MLQSQICINKFQTESAAQASLWETMPKNGSPQCQRMRHVEPHSFSLNDLQKRMHVAINHHTYETTMFSVAQIKLCASLCRHSLNACTRGIITHTQFNVEVDISHIGQINS